MTALKCEHFMRQAFGYALNQGQWIERGEDPGGLAEAAIFGAATPQAKAAIIYASKIYTDKLERLNSESDYSFIDQFPQSVFDASTSAELADLIDGFRETIINQYYEVNDGIVESKK
jgi:hypothetical protein